MNVAAVVLNLNVFTNTYRVRHNEVAPYNSLHYSQPWLGLSVQNFMDLLSHHIHIHTGINNILLSYTPEIIARKCCHLAILMR